MDLYFLEKAGHDLVAAIPDARTKYGGWEPAVVAMLLDVLHVRDIPEWLIKEVSVNDLEVFLNRLRLAIAAYALPWTYD